MAGANFKHYSPILVENKYIISNDSGDLYVIDPENGIIIEEIEWAQNIYTCSDHEIAYYEGAIYFTGDFTGNSNGHRDILYGVDLKDYSIFLEMESKYSSCFNTASFNAFPNIDLKTGRMYLHDGTSLYCFQLETRL